MTVDTKPPATITVAEYDTISLVVKVGSHHHGSEQHAQLRHLRPSSGPIGPMALKRRCLVRQPQECRHLRRR